MSVGKGFLVRGANFKVFVQKVGCKVRCVHYGVNYVCGFVCASVGRGMLRKGGKRSRLQKSRIGYSKLELTKDTGSRNLESTKNWREAIKDKSGQQAFFKELRFDLTNEGHEYWSWGGRVRMGIREGRRRWGK